MISLDGVLCIDLEASGLHEGSFPIELGWAGFDGRSGGWLITPAKDWTRADWEDGAEAIHGISWDELLQRGTAARDVAEAFYSLVMGPPCLQLISDAASFDQGWLGRLFQHSPHDAPQVGEAVGLANRLGGRAATRELIERLEGSPRPHRAEADACRLRDALVAVTRGGHGAS